MTERPLVDGQGRRIAYLRLSLTDRCNFRCSYCAPAGPDRGGDPLSRAELARLVRIFAGEGVRRVRLTGGEPTLRPDLLEVVRDVRGTPGIEEVALTTNGHALGALAAPLREAGVSRLNISLDTLDPDRLHRIAGRAASLDRIVAGIEAALRAGFESVKLNVVVVRGENEHELGALTRFAWRLGATPRFIELMPFGAGRPVPTAEVKALLAAQGVALEADATRGWGPAHHMRGTSAADSSPDLHRPAERGLGGGSSPDLRRPAERGSGGGGERLAGLVGFIGAMTESFCDGCNRVRVGADGALRACLGGRDRVPLAEPLRAGASDAEIAERIRSALLAKRDRHRMGEDSSGLIPMIGTGG